MNHSISSEESLWDLAPLYEYSYCTSTPFKGFHMKLLDSSSPRTAIEAVAGTKLIRVKSPSKSPPNEPQSTAYITLHDTIRCLSKRLQMAN